MIIIPRVAKVQQNTGPPISPPTDCSADGASGTTSDDSSKNEDEVLPGLSNMQLKYLSKLPRLKLTILPDTRKIARRTVRQSRFQDFPIFGSTPLLRGESGKTAVRLSRNRHFVSMFSTNPRRAWKSELRAPHKLSHSSTSWFPSSKTSRGSRLSSRLY